MPPWTSLCVVERVGSTNDEVKRLARDGAPEGTLMRALAQDAGRGRRGRVWQAPPGNLMFSLLLRPGGDLARASQLSFLTALAVGEAVGAVIPGAPKLKWPNDVLVDGAKVAGILLEAEAAPSGAAEWVVVGVGVNVRHHPTDVDYPATSLAALRADTGPEIEAADVLALFARAFDRWYARWQQYGFAPVRAAWLNAAQGLGKPVTVRLADQTFAGVFADLDADGALLVDTDQGRRRVTSGDVFSFGG